jgi:hypothetical protein
VPAGSGLRSSRSLYSRSPSTAWRVAAMWRGRIGGSEQFARRHPRRFRLRDCRRRVDDQSGAEREAQPTSPSASVERGTSHARRFRREKAFRSVSSTAEDPHTVPINPSYNIRLSHTQSGSPSRFGLCPMGADSAVMARKECHLLRDMPPVGTKFADVRWRIQPSPGSPRPVAGNASDEMVLTNMAVRHHRSR